MIRTYDEIIATIDNDPFFWFRCCTLDMGGGQPLFWVETKKDRHCERRDNQVARLGENDEKTARILRYAADVAANRSIGFSPREDSPRCRPLEITRIVSPDAFITDDSGEEIRTKFGRS